MSSASKVRGGGSEAEERRRSCGDIVRQGECDHDTADIDTDMIRSQGESLETIPENEDPEKKTAID